MKRDRIKGSFLRLLTILFFTVLLFGFKDMFSIGVHSDDWERYEFFSSNINSTVIRSTIDFSKTYPLLFYRFPQVFPYSLTYLINKMTNNAVFGFVAVNVILNFFIMVILYKILDFLIGDKRLSLLSTFFISTLFNRDSTLYWGSTQTINFSLVFFFLVVYMIVKDSNNYFLFFFFTLLSVWSYEIGIFIPLFVLIYDFVQKKKFDLSTVLKVISTSVSIVIVLSFKFFIFPKFIGSVEKASSIGDALNLDNIYSLPFHTGSFFLKFNPIINYFKHHNHLVYKYVFISLVFLTFVYIFNRKNSTHKLAVNNDNVLLCGLLIFSLSVFVMYMLGLNFSFVGKGNRVLIFSLFGYGILILWAVLSIRNDIIISIILIICTSLNVGLLSYSRNLYIESWGLQERILNNIKQNSDFEALSNGYHVVYLYNVKKTLEFGTPFIDEFWTSTYFMRFVTENKDIEAYVVSDPKDIKLKSEWTKDSINKEDVFIYDVGNNTLYKYYDE